MMFAPKSQSKLERLEAFKQRLVKENLEHYFHDALGVHISVKLSGGPRIDVWPTTEKWVSIDEKKFPTYANGLESFWTYIANFKNEIEGA